MNMTVKFCGWSSSGISTGNNYRRAAKHETMNQEAKRSKRMRNEKNICMKTISMNKKRGVRIG
jgi:hypothetical protein